MLNVTIKGIEELKRFDVLTNPALLQKAQKGGITYASKSVPPAVAKGISASYNITSARIKQDVSGIRFNSDRTEATIRFSRRPPTLTQFRPTLGTRGHQPGLGRGMGWGPAQPKGRPLRATLVRGHRLAFPGAFPIAGNSGNQLIVRRNRQGTVSSIYGPSIGSIVTGQSAIGAQLRSTIEARINEQYQKGVQRVLDAAARGH